MFDELDREIFKRGQQIFNVGDPGECAYLIEDGSVEVLGKRRGREYRISLLGKGEMFGEVALIDHQPRTATVRAVEDTVLVPISRKLVDGLLEKSDPILHHLLLVVLDRFRNEKVSEDRSLRIPVSHEEYDRRKVLEGEATHKLALAHGLARALTHDEFQLYYQPICQLSDGRVAGFEALLRWQDPARGMMQPMDFLWLAEQTGLVRDLGLWTLERACRDWPLLRQSAKAAAPFVSVNLSAAQLAGESLVKDVKDIMVRYHMVASELKLELTETVIIEHPDIALQVLTELTNLGCSLALDDFGTGYSGLGHLQRYPIGTIKVDRAFTTPMLESAQSYEIVRSSIALAHSLGMNVVAEGVETKALHDKLLELGCDFGQGWYYGEPAALEDVTKRYRAA
ncbi:MAG TPA: EAL domain-containing protein [Gallionella sp.]|nr:EAL domain-containing protein [Gallionella sp.]